MPAPEKQAMADMAKTIFRSKGLALPGKWQRPGRQFTDAFAMEEKQVRPNAPLNLFREPTLNKYHVDSSREVGRKFDAFIEGITAAICEAVDQWIKSTFICCVTINGAVGLMPPGSLVGPALLPLILSTAPKNTFQEIRYSAAIAGAVDRQWKLWQAGVAGMLSYPSLAAISAPLAPPIANVPQVLMALPSAGEAALSPAALRAEMHRLLDDPEAQHADVLFEAVARAFSNAFQKFKSTSLVQNVLGTGPVPTFAPPAVPAGPVMGGTVIPKPGVLV
jgi:hypothetical protein